MYYLSDVQLFIICLAILFLFLSGFAIAIYYRKTQDDKTEIVSN